MAVLNEKETNLFILNQLAKSKLRFWVCSPWITRRDIKRYLDKIKDVRIILGFSNKRDIKITDIAFLQEINNLKNVQVKINNRAHRKIYIFDSCALVGSSNLTHMGLGQGQNYNLETSVALNEIDEIKEVIKHFEETWETSTSISELDVELIKKKPKIRSLKEILELFKPHNPLERILS